MLRSDADAPKPPAYPFIHHQCQRAQTQKSQNRQSLGASRNRASRVSYHRNLPIPITNPAVTASPRPVRFGEPVFTNGGRQLQEEKCERSKFFLPTPYFVGSNACLGGSAPGCLAA
jgi:hypothetical protein